MCNRAQRVASGGIGGGSCDKACLNGLVDIADIKKEGDMGNLKGVTLILVGCWIGSGGGFQSLIDGYAGFSLAIPYATLGLTLLGVYCLVDLASELPGVIREHLGRNK